MDVFLIVIAILMSFAGAVGTVLPIIPGTLLSYGAIIVMQFTDKIQYSISFMVVMAVLALLVIVLDYLLPPYITKRFGGSIYASRGAFIGMLAGIVLSPIGMILGAILGAFIGERFFAKKRGSDAFNAVIGSFLGFIAGTGIKLIYSIYIIYKVIKPLL